MLEKPRLEDEKIIACLKTSYGLTVTGIEFLPLGYDSYAGVYRVHGDGQTYFLKAKRDAVDELSVRLPRYLKEQGIEQVVAPLPTVAEELWGKVDDFTLILYPYIDGKPGSKVGLSDRQWLEFGAVLKKLHTMRLSPDLEKQISKETYAPNPHWGAVVKQLQASIGNQGYESPAQRQLAAFWKGKHREIGDILYRTEQLGRMLPDRALDLVVCHADIHTGNLLIDTQARLFIVDWDQPILSPRERDLMFVTVGGFVSAEREETLFFQGYGKTELDPVALAYYRYARAVEDMGGFGEHVFLMEAGEDTKQDSVAWFMTMFEPGNLVEAARKLDQALHL